MKGSAGVVCMGVWEWQTRNVSFICQSKRGSASEEGGRNVRWMKTRRRRDLPVTGRAENGFSDSA